MTFVKGTSGNPGGRPHADIQVKQLARAHTVPAINALVRGLKAKGERTRIAAAEALLNRGWGSPSQHHEIDAGDELVRRLSEAAKRVIGSED